MNVRNERRVLHASDFFCNKFEKYCSLVKAITLSLPLQESTRALDMHQENENIQQNTTNNKSARKWRVPAAAEDSLRSLQHALSNSPSSKLAQATALLSEIYPNVHPSNQIDHSQDKFLFRGQHSRTYMTLAPAILFFCQDHITVTLSATRMCVTIFPTTSRTTSMNTSWRRQN
jgi:hypothetical protein